MRNAAHRITKILFIVLVFGQTLTSCHSKEKETAAQTATKEETKKATMYTCSMHPQVRLDHPGSCPICGMTLVPVEDSAPDEKPSGDHPDKHAAFEISPLREQMIGVKYGIVEKKNIFKTIEAAGRVAFDPELYTAQAEYLEALKQLQGVKNSPVANVYDSAQQMVDSARLRLKILGLSDSQIAKLQSKGSSSLLLPKAGENIWIYAEVFEMDLPYVQAGLDVSMEGSSLEGETIKGKIVSVDRVLNPIARTARVRIEVKNAKAKLRPESYLNVSILSPLGEQITVPFDAVFDTGKDAWVFISSGEGKFEPRKINIKFRSGDEVAVASGLSGGEKIVTSANFLIDSESRLKAVQL